MLSPKRLRNAPRAQLAVAALTFLLVLTFLNRSSGSSPSFPDPSSQSPSHSSSSSKQSDVHENLPPVDVACDVDVAYLSQLELSDKIKYARLDIHVSVCPSSGACPSTSMNTSLPDFREISLEGSHDDDDDADDNGDDSELKGCPSPVQIQLPPVPVRPDASHIIVGVATKIDRLQESLVQFPHWMGHTGIRLIAILEPTTAERVLEVEERARSLGIALEIQQSDAEYNDRYFSLTKVIYENRDEATEWGLIIDDDTFFPSIGAVLEFLGTLDATKPHYVGGLTEDFYQTRNFGYMGYGGAGVFLSIPLLRQIHPYYKECNENKSTGDRRIADCVHWYTLAKFAPNALLHQLDVGGDVSGFYESGRTQPLSIHHWKSWHKANVTAMFAVSTVTGDDALLRRWKFVDGWYFTNGYSIVKYSKDLAEGDFSMEQTWNGAGNFGHSMDPTRPKDEKKISFQLKAAERIYDGHIVRQFYVKSQKWHDDEVVEVVWRRV